MNVLNLNPAELINVLIVLGLLVLLLRKQDAVMLLLILFVYGTFHFSFAVTALTANASTSLIDMHNEGSGLLAKFSSLIALVVLFSLLGRCAYKAILPDMRMEIEYQFILLLMLVLFCGYLLNYRAGDLLQLKNIVSIEAMLVLVMLGSLAITGMSGLKAENTFSWVVALVVFGIIDAIALYEVLTHFSWAGTQESAGAYVYRASSVLFNPNLYAFWAALVYLACAYGYHSYRERRYMLLLGMVLASTAIYLSGSRSEGYLLLALLCLLPFLVRDRWWWVPLLVLPLTMLAIYVGAQLPSDTSGQELVLLGERFAAAPVHLANYIAQRIGIPEVAVLPPEVAVSIEGRFMGEGRDAGWLVLYQDAGWGGLGAVIMACCFLIVRGISTYLARPNPASVYTLVLLLYCLLTGLVMRFQIFPVWLFIGLSLIICMVYQRSVLIASDRTRRWRASADF